MLWRIRNNFILNALLAVIWTSSADAIPNVTLSPSSPVYITDGGLLNLTCSVDQDVGLGSVLFRRFGLLVIQINTSMSECMYHKADSADTYRYSVTCHQNKTVTMLRQGVNNSDNDTTWSCEMVSASEHNGPCNKSGNLCISQNVTVFMGLPVTSVRMINGTRLAFQEGESVVIVCETDACRPSADIYWIINGISIRNSSVDVISLAGHLFITIGRLSYTAQRYDNGYALACGAYNGFGSTQISDNLTLIIYYPPTVYTMQSIYRVIEKQTFNLTCQAKSNPQPHIFWSPSGEAYDPSMLYFNSVSRNNSGNYTCTAINNMTSTSGVQWTGSDTRRIEVDVLYPPAIYSPTSPYKVIENQTLDVTCQVISNPTPDQIYWSPSGDSYFSRLYFKSVSRNKSGNYTCTARNNMTTVDAQQIGLDTRQIEVDVLYPPTVFVGTKLYKVIENQTLKVTCQVNSHPPPDQIFWSPRGEASDLSRLYFKSVSRNNSGNYSCTARNTMTPTVGRKQEGSDTKQIAVDILYTATITEFTAKDNIYELFENSSLQLHCRVESNPYSVISLYHGDNLKFRVQDTHELKYTSTVGCLDAGNYTCSASNSLMNGATVSADAHIKVLCKPGIPTEFEINGRGHDSVTLEWTPGFRGSSPQFFFIEYRILPDGKWLTTSPASEDTNLKKQYFTVYGLQQETSYEFQMFAINNVGLSTYTNVINVTTSGIIGEYNRHSAPIAPLVGGVLGAVAVAVIIIIAVVIAKRRGCCNKNSTKLDGEISTKHKEDNIGNDTLSSASRTDPQYSNIHQIKQKKHKDPSMNKTADLELTDIEIGDETNFRNSIGNNYDTLHQYVNADMTTYIALRSENHIEGEHKIYENTTTPEQKGQTKKMLSLRKKGKRVRSGYKTYENTKTLTEKNQ